jgi:DNA-directed RNA polymerase specialized sigma24 family protein
MKLEINEAPADRIIRIVAGNAPALASELPRLVHLATRPVRDPDQAEDSAQETIVGA